MLDLYCERCDAGFWAEPLNAFTNASFLVAAFLAWRSAKLRRVMTTEIGILITLAATIGVGSFLFHTLATVWAMWLDVIPILLFQVWFIWVYSRQQLGCSRLASGGMLGGLLVLALLARPQKEILNGSLMYLPAWLLLVAFGVCHLRMNKQGSWLLMVAGILMFIALVFRTIDQAVCETLPCGTHFLWHLFNGGVLYLAMQSLILNQPPHHASAGETVS